MMSHCCLSHCLGCSLQDRARRQLQGAAAARAGDRERRQRQRKGSADTTCPAHPACPGVEQPLQDPGAGCGCEQRRCGVVRCRQPKCLAVLWLCVHPVFPRSLPDAAAVPPINPTPGFAALLLGQAVRHAAQQHQVHTKFLAGFFGACFIVAGKYNSVGSWTSFAFIIFAFLIGFVMERTVR